MICGSGRTVCSLLQLSERWPCHIRLFGNMKFASLVANSGGGRMKFASLEANLGGSLFFFLFSLPLSRSSIMTEIMLTGTLSLNTINQHKMMTTSGA